MTAKTTKHRAPVLGCSMAYRESGTGDPVVFLHGNPTSSYLWRNVIPHVESLGRCIAPDLIGMGDSDPMPDGTYRFVDHRRYLDAFLDHVGAVERVTLVLHDWGSALGFDWARRHPDAVKGIAYMEAIVRPFALTELPAPVQPVFAALRSPAGDELIFGQDLFVEKVLPDAILRPLDPAELDEYRRPFRDPARRMPTLAWPRELPIDGAPRDVVEIVAAYGAWLAASPVPKLSSTPNPGCSSPAYPASSAAAGPTRPRSPSPDSTSCRRTLRTRSGARSRTGTSASDRKGPAGDGQADHRRDWLGSRPWRRAWGPPVVIRLGRGLPS